MPNILHSLEKERSDTTNTAWEKLSRVVLTPAPSAAPASTKTGWKALQTNISSGSRTAVAAATKNTNGGGKKFSSLLQAKPRAEVPVFKRAPWPRPREMRQVAPPLAAAKPGTRNIRPIIGRKEMEKNVPKEGKGPKAPSRGSKNKFLEAAAAVKKTKDKSRKVHMVIFLYKCVNKCINA